MTVNSLEATSGWFRVCWSIRSDGRTVEQGTLTGRDVPSMLASLRDYLPLAPQDAETVRADADTPGGWRFASDTISVHTHHTPIEGAWLPCFGCPERQEGEAL
ncbi:hypothetical protein [Streptomyces sp. NPDC002845]